MKTTTIETIKTIYSRFEYLDFIELDYDIETLEDFISSIESQSDYIYENEIIGFYNASKFLLEEDPSLRDSLEIAYEYGYTADKINSEILASLLLQRYIETDLGNFLYDLKNIEEDED